jgi:hypothetical protein
MNPAPTPPAAPEFTEQDFNALIGHAASAPLQNLIHSENVKELINKFARWYRYVNQPAPPVAAPPSS